MPITEAEFKEQFKRFKEANDGRFDVNESDCLPCLSDIGNSHSYCPVYLYHVGWAARVLAQSKPTEHVDIGGLTYFAAIASAIVPLRYYDIQPIHMPLPGVKTGAANLTHLPFKNNEIGSLSCMHVMEHVGLGRYGDELDPTGDLKSASELMRVLAPGGQLLMVLPIQGKPLLQFNGHRVYSYDMIVEMFKGLTLKEFTLIHLPDYVPNADPDRARRMTGEGAGCFWFVKE